MSFVSATEPTQTPRPQEKQTTALPDATDMTKTTVVVPDVTSKRPDLTTSAPAAVSPTPLCKLICSDFEQCIFVDGRQECVCKDGFVRQSGTCQGWL